MSPTSSSNNGKALKHFPESSAAWAYSHFSSASVLFSTLLYSEHPVVKRNKTAKEERIIEVLNMLKRIKCEVSKTLL